MVQRRTPLRKLKRAAGVVAAFVVLCYAVRFVGLHRFENELEVLAAEPPELLASPVAAKRNAAVPFRELIRLLKAGEVSFEPNVLYDPDPAEEPEVHAALVAWGTANDRGEDVYYGDALEESVSEVLQRSNPSAEAWTLVSSWLPELEGELFLIDRVCERSAWWFGDEGERHETGADHRAERIGVLLDVSPWVVVTAVHDARERRFDDALARLRQGFHLAAAVKNDPTSVSFLAFAFQLDVVLDGMQRILETLPPRRDLGWLADGIERIDTMDLLRRGVVRERFNVLEFYREKRISPDDVELGFPFAGKKPRFTIRKTLYPLTRGYDALRFLRLSEEALEALGGSHADALRAAKGRPPRVARGPWYAPTAPVLARYLDVGIESCVDLESQLRLARIALTDYREGRATAFGALERSLDPATDEPIRHRVEEDGTITLWCGGSDGVAGNGRPDRVEDWESDVVWVLPARR